MIDASKKVYISLTLLPFEETSTHLPFHYKNSDKMASKMSQYCSCIQMPFKLGTNQQSDSFEPFKIRIKIPTVFYIFNNKIREILNKRKDQIA